MARAVAPRARTVTPTSRPRALLEMAVVGAACALSFALLTPDVVAHGGLLVRIALPLRMALLVLLASWFVWRGGERWADLGLRRPSSLWLTALLAVAGFLAAGLASVAVVKLLLPPLGLARPASAVLQVVRGDLAQLLYWLIPVAWGSAAFGEEMLFRGFFLDRMRKLLGSGRPALWLAVLGQAALFGAAHFYQGAGGVLINSAVGLILGAVFVLGGRNLWPAILMHGLVDSASLMALYLGTGR